MEALIMILQLVVAVGAFVTALAIVGTYGVAKRIAEHTATISEAAKRSEVNLMNMEQRLARLEMHAQYQSSLMGSE